jgi:hypothetical protein
MIQNQALLHSNGSSVPSNSKQMSLLKTVLMRHLTRFFPFNFFIHAGVFGVGSVLYLPKSKDPLFLVITPPMGWDTVAILPEPVAPAVAFSAMNSLALI